MINGYYKNENVRARFVEFLGGRALDESPTAYIIGEGTSADVQYLPRRVSELWECLDRNFDVGRSLWDREWLIAHLDIEYVNFDDPGIAYTDPRRAFELQRPILDATLSGLSEHGIAPLQILSGRGYHLLWKIHRQSEAFGRLVWHGHVSETARTKYRHPQPPHEEIVGDELGSAFAGLGQIMEFLAHRILRDASPNCCIPIMLTAIEVGPGRRGREIVSIDISEYGDPLFTRAVRMPFSLYLKPEQQRYALGNQVVDRLPSLFQIPRTGLDIAEGLNIMRDVNKVADLAGSTSAVIPDMSTETLKFIDDYTRSDLARFHEEFYSDEHDPPESWPNTYDKTPMNTLPLCIQKTLTEPNDMLMKPAAIQLVVRALLAIGWRPRHIAGLIRSKYERDYGWGERWYRHDASTRADFYTRMFAGLLHTGLDELIDFNCVSTQEKGYCRVENCGNSLTPLYDISIG